MSSHVHTQASSTPITFNPLPDYHPLAQSAERMAQAYDVDSATERGELFGASTLGELQAQGAYLFAVRAAQAKPERLIWHCQSALLARLGLSNHAGLSHEQELLRGFIIGLMGNLEQAFEQPEGDE
ncbi:hypothetical protein [Chitinilyticum litopenaei]|uniref:hypothetical protein n=1 Tax=Chitinilyticum litopenaei TaxID=1121276 RepID=UPI000422AF27|nr:hypothetical protein [Chitinilyticum litopenaei]